MVGADFARTMARYNGWQNRSLYTAADGLTDEERRKDRGAFFKSIHATLNHLLWADSMWLSRLAGLAKPNVNLADSPHFQDDWEILKRDRLARDEDLIRWADGIDDAWLGGDLTWHSGAANRDLTKPRWTIVAHIFNHQAHHRGQIHAMLTAAGAKPEATDLIFMKREDA